MFTGDIPPVQPVALENPDGFCGMESFSRETGFTLIWGVKTDYYNSTIDTGDVY